MDDKTIDHWQLVATARKQVLASNWGGSTDLRSVFKRIAELEAKREHVEGEPVKEVVLTIFTDMAFNDATRQYGGKTGNMLQEDVLKEVCTQAGLAKVPTIVYFDVCGSSTMQYAASANTSGVVLISGYSESALKAIASANFDDISPLAFMLTALAELPYEITDDMVVD
jgi:hypothetical protein